MTTDIDHLQKAEICPVCGSTQVSVFWEMLEVPVHCNVLCATRDEAMNVPRGDIRLAVCEECGFVFNMAFNANRMRYGHSYENPLDYSPRFQKYAHTLARHLIERYYLHDKQIIEIACGKGGFLKLLCELGNNRGVGFDPGHVPMDDEDGCHGRLAFVQDYYSSQYADYQADLICCRHALEHIQEPIAFLRMLRQNIGDKRDTAVFFEVPNVLFTLRDLGIWDIIYEHCSYFSAGSFSCCFQRAGFKVASVTEAYGKQYLCIEAMPDEAGSGQQQDIPKNKDAVLSQAHSYTSKSKKKLQEWSSRLGQLEQKGRQVVLWGAGSKGVTFLNMIERGDRIASVVDINPHKQGMYVAGTAHPIVSPDHLRCDRSITIIVMNPLYVDEIRHMVERMDVSAEYLVA